MIKIKANKEILELPEVCREIKLSQFIDYNVYKKKWVESIEQHGIFSIESLKSLRDLLFNFFDKNPVIDTLKIDFADSRNGALSIAKHIDAVIEGLKPRTIDKEHHTFDYKGETLFVPFGEAYQYLKEEFSRPELTLGEVVEIMEYKRLTENMVLESGDPQGNLAFTEALRTIAILARKENEVLPSVKTDKWIFDRMTWLKDISFQDYADVYFFLTSIGVQLKMTDNTSIFSILRRELLEAPSRWN